MRWRGGGGRRGGGRGGEWEGERGGRVGRGMERCVGLWGESIEMRERFGERKYRDA